MATRMQQRRGTAQQWTDADPILAAGEIGFETDTNQFKIGDGVNAWSDLSYFKNLEDLGGSFEDYVLANAVGTANGIASLDSTGNVPIAQLGNLIDGAPELLNTINELAAAINDNADFANTVLTSVSSAQSAAESYADGLITAEQTARGNAIANAVGVHNDDTTSVHGIANTAALITTSILATTESNITDAYTNAITEASSTILSDYTSAISTHGSDTSNVHGIADTTALATMTYADSAASNAQAAAELTAQGELATHASDTSSVHGISNTLALVTLAGTETLSNKTILEPAIEFAQSGAALGWTGTTKEIRIPDYSGSTVTLATVAQVDAAIVSADSASTSAIGTHNSATANVHGIADTSKLVTTDASTQTISGSLTITGDLTVQGNSLTVSANSLVINDPMIYMGENNSGNSVDLGIVSSYTDGGAYVHTGFVRDASDSKWKLFTGVSDEPTTTVNFGQGSLDNLAVNNVEVAGVVFTDGTQTKEGVVSRTPIIQKTASYTLSALTERDSMIEVANSSATTITIPTNSSVAYPVGTSIDVLQTSTGQVTIAGAVGVTVNATPGLKLRTQWSGATLFKRAENTWVVYGDLSA